MGPSPSYKNKNKNIKTVGLRLFFTIGGHKKKPRSTIFIHTVVSCILSSMYDGDLCGI